MFVFKCVNVRYVKKILVEIIILDQKESLHLKNRKKYPI